MFAGQVVLQYFAIWYCPGASVVAAQRSQSTRGGAGARLSRSIPVLPFDEVKV